MELILNNLTLSAQEALAFGLVNRVVPPEACLVGEIAARAPLAVRFGKEAVNHAFEALLAEGIADERRAFYFLFSTQNHKEGLQAFIAKRNREWKEN